MENNKDNYWKSSEILMSVAAKYMPIFPSIKYCKWWIDYIYELNGEKDKQISKLNDELKIIKNEVKIMKHAIKLAEEKYTKTQNTKSGH